jgi:serine/threonine protein kinase, bacterial
MNKHFTLCGWLFMAAVATATIVPSCKKSSPDAPGNPPPIPVKITSFSPATAAMDSTLTITGSGFSKTASANTVSFYGKTGVVLAATDTTLTIKVPQGAQDGKISVKVGALSDSTATDFTYIYTVSTLAGSTTGYVDAKGTNAKFGSVMAVTTDAAGNVYASDFNNNLIRKITPDGTVTSIAGVLGDDTKLGLITGLAIDASGNIYTADNDRAMIQKITPAGTIDTLAGTGFDGYNNAQGTLASFYVPRGVVVDPNGNVYVADGLNNVIRKIDPSGMVTTFAGDHSAGTFGGWKDGNADVAQFADPTGIALDAKGNLYVCDGSFNVIRKINTSGVVSTLAGNGQSLTVDGTGSNASFNGVQSLTIDNWGNIFVSEFYGGRIRKISPSGVVRTIAGNGNFSSDNGLGVAASFTQPYSIAADANGVVYVADAASYRVRKIQ